MFSQLPFSSPLMLPLLGFWKLSSSSGCCSATKILHWFPTAFRMKFKLLSSAVRGLLTQAPCFSPFPSGPRAPVAHILLGLLFQAPAPLGHAACLGDPSYHLCPRSKSTHHSRPRAKQTAEPPPKRNPHSQIPGERWKQRPTDLAGQSHNLHIYFISPQ